MLVHRTAIVLYLGLVPLSASRIVAEDGEVRAEPRILAEPSSIEAETEAPEERGRAMVVHWQALVAELEEAARREDVNQLQKKSSTLLAEMKHHVATGHEELLARALRLESMQLALVLRSQSAQSASSGTTPRRRRSGRGSTPDPGYQRMGGGIGALWLARLLWPPVVDDLDSFGDVGSMFAESLREADRRAADLRELASQERARETFVPPNLQGSRELRYTPAARAAGLEGVVRIRYLIDESGVPAFPEILGGDVPSSLLIAAIEAVLASRFEPAMVGRRAVPAEDTIAVSFESP